MDRLTREGIYSLCEDLKAAMLNWRAESRWERINQLRDLALSALSREAVRDEVLEEAASVDQREVELRGWREAIRALKREPNAAGGASDD